MYEYKLTLSSSDIQFQILTEKFDPTYDRPKKRIKKKLGIVPENIYNNYPDHISPLAPHLIQNKKCKGKKDSKDKKELEKSKKSKGVTKKKGKKGQKSLVIYILFNIFKNN